MGPKWGAAHQHCWSFLLQPVWVKGELQQRPVDRKRLAFKTNPAGDSPLTLGKVSAVGSYYTAAAFLPDDWRGTGKRRAPK